jgi:hypothetical protein
MDGGVDLCTPATNPTGILDSVAMAHLPMADIPQHNAGLTFDEAMTCLAVFAGHQGLAGLVGALAG